MRSSSLSGEPGEVIYGIIKGEVELWVNDQVVETIKQGDIFGEGALVHPDHKRDETASAKTDSLLAFLDRQHFLFAVDQTPMESPGSNAELFRSTATLETPALIGTESTDVSKVELASSE